VPHAGLSSVVNNGRRNWSDARPIDSHHSLLVLTGYAFVAGHFDYGWVVGHDTDAAEVDFDHQTVSDLIVFVHP
jgi:hypothetical protein